MVCVVRELWIIRTSLSNEHQISTASELFLLSSNVLDITLQVQSSVLFERKKKSSILCVSSGHVVDSMIRRGGGLSFAQKKNRQYDLQAAILDDANC